MSILKWKRGTRRYDRKRIELFSRSFDGSFRYSPVWCRFRLFFLRLCTPSRYFRNFKKLSFSLTDRFRWINISLLVFNISIYSRRVSGGIDYNRGAGVEGIEFKYRSFEGKVYRPRHPHSPFLSSGFLNLFTLLLAMPSLTFGCGWWVRTYSLRN